MHHLDAKKRLEKKLDGNCTTILRAILNKTWRQQPTKHQLYGHLPPITKTIQVRRTRHAGHYWRSRDELISDVTLWTPTYGRAKAGRPDRTYILQLCEDTGCRSEDLPEAMNDREKWREIVRDIRAGSTTWWRCWYMYIYTHIYAHIYSYTRTHTNMNTLAYLSLIGIILRWGFLIWELIFIYCGLFFLVSVVFVLFLLSLRFGQISPLAFFRWFTATSDRNAESCNRITSNYCLP